MANQIKVQSCSLIVILLIILLWGCHKKGLPAISERKAPPPTRIITVYPPLETVAIDTAAGRQIFMSGCNRCHVLPSAGQFNMARWDKVLPVMIPRARLSNEQALHLRGWIMAHAAAQ